MSTEAASAAQPDISMANSKGSRCIWTDADDVIIVRVLRLQKDAGNQSGAGWKKQVWTVVEAALKAESVSAGALKTTTKCSDHWANVSIVFLFPRFLVNISRLLVKEALC